MSHPPKSRFTYQSEETLYLLQAYCPRSESVSITRIDLLRGYDSALGPSSLGASWREWEHWRIGNVLQLLASLTIPIAYTGCHMCLLPLCRMIALCELRFVSDSIHRIVFRPATASANGLLRIELLCTQRIGVVISSALCPSALMVCPRQTLKKSPLHVRRLIKHASMRGTSYIRARLLVVSLFRTAEPACRFGGSWLKRVNNALVCRLSRPCNFDSVVYLCSETHVQRHFSRPVVAC